jgi:ABC-type transporter MlaC component
VVVDTDGYEALIEHLSLNLSVFTSDGDTGSESIEDVISDMMSSNIMALFAQNPEMHSSVRFRLLKEVDLVVEDLAEVLAGCWLRKATNEQVEFLDEFVSLLKNLFDSAVTKYD